MKIPQTVSTFIYRQKNDTNFNIKHQKNDKNIKNPFNISQSINQIYEYQSIHFN